MRAKKYPMSRPVGLLQGGIQDQRTPRLLIVRHSDKMASPVPTRRLTGTRHTQCHSHATLMICPLTQPLHCASRLQVADQLGQSWVENERTDPEGADLLTKGRADINESGDRVDTTEAAESLRHLVADCEH